MRTLSVLLLALLVAPVLAQNMIMTFQGQLRDNGSPANGTYSMTFGLFSVASGGTAIATFGPVNVSVSNGLFTQELTYPRTAIDGNARWIEVSVVGTTLVPRSKINETPMAAYATRAGSVPWSGVTGAPMGADAWAFTHTDIRNANAGFVGIGARDPVGVLHVKDALDFDDQIQNLHSGYGYTGSPGLWQTFQPGVAGELTGVTVLLYASQEFPDIVVRIHEGELGAVVADERFTLLGPAGYAFRHIPITSRPMLAQDQTYTIFIATPWQESYWAVREGNPYPRGRAISNDALDMWFVTHMKTGETDSLVASRGRIGIGTVQPTETLDVRGNVFVDNAVKLSASDRPMVVRQHTPFTGGNKAGYGRWGLFMEPARLFLGVPGSDYGGRLTLGGWLADGTMQPWLTILSANGNVGIGQDSPGFPLNFDNTLGDKVSFHGNSGAHYGIGIQGGLLQIHTDVASSDIAFGYGTSASMTEAMRIKGNGNVGIGTNAPTARLHVVGGAIRPAVGNSSAAGISFPVDPGGGSGDDAFIRYYAESGEDTKLLIGINNDFNDDLSFWQAGAERMTLYNGNVGIGTNQPPYRLTIQGGEIRFLTTGGATLYRLANFNDAGEMTTLGPNGTRNALLGQDSSSANRGLFAVFDDAGTNRATMYVNASNQGIVAANVKAFREFAPNDPEHDYWYASLEGPEAAMYVRGTAQLINGRAVVQLPDHFAEMAVEGTMTVLLTPMTVNTKGLGIVSQSLAGIEVGELDNGRGTFPFHWEAKAVRKGYEEWKVKRPWYEVGVHPHELQEAWEARLKSIESQKNAGKQ